MPEPISPQPTTPTVRTSPGSTASVLRDKGCRVSGKPTIEACATRILGAGGAVLGVAGLGLVLGHWLTYLLDVPDAHARAAVLAQSGHAYLPFATRVATIAGIATFAVAFLGRLVRHDRDWSARSTFAWLAGFQVGAFLTMEILERATSGASVLHLFHGTILPVGILVQLVIAAVGVVLLRLLLRAADAIADLLHGTPSPFGPALVWAVRDLRRVGPRAQILLLAPTRGPPAPLLR